MSGSVKRRPLSARHVFLVFLRMRMNICVSFSHVIHQNGRNAGRAGLQSSKASRSKYHFPLVMFPTTYRARETKIQRVTILLGHFQAITSEYISIASLKWTPARVLCRELHSYRSVAMDISMTK